MFSSLYVNVIFLSTPSARRATVSPLFGIPVFCNFYPRPPRGGRRAMTTAVSHTLNFYPRPPRGGRQMHHWECITRQLISIHALREEGDRFKRDYSLLTTIFLSTPSARRATGQEGVYQHRKEFLSTPSARRATYFTSCLPNPQKDFYPRPPRGGRPDDVFQLGLFQIDFYPRPPRGGRQSSH